MALVNSGRILKQPQPKPVFQDEKSFVRKRQENTWTIAHQNLSAHDKSQNPQNCRLFVASSRNYPSTFRFEPQEPGTVLPRTLSRISSLQLGENFSSRCLSLSVCLSLSLSLYLSLVVITKSVWTFAQLFTVNCQNIQSCRDFTLEKVVNGREVSSVEYLEHCLKSGANEQANRTKDCIKQ